MKKLRYKLYGTILIIFIITTAFISITNYREENIKKTYYSGINKIISEKIENTAKNLKEHIEKKSNYRLNKTESLEYNKYAEKMINSAKIEIKKESDKYFSLLDEKNINNIIIIFIMLALFVIIYYLESKYHNKIKEHYKKERTRISERYKALKKMSQTDELTKYYNRQYLSKKISLAFKKFQEGGSESSIILFDIDDFKNINDTYGHNIGDKVLIEVSKTVEENIDKEDIPVRWGGEEFIIFFKYKSINSVLKTGEKIRKAIENLTIKADKNNIKVTISIGISSFKEFDLEATDCIDRADEAMYISKRTGKNKVTLYNKAKKETAR